MSKNTYYLSKPECPELKKAEDSSSLKPISLLIDEDEEVTELLGEAGFIKSILKSDKFTKITYLCVFSERLLDHEAAVKLAKSVSFASTRKELGIVEQNILNE